MALLDTPRSKAVLAVLLAGLIAYMGYTGDGLSFIGVEGLRVKQERVRSLQDSIAAITASTDSVKRELATGSIEELQKRTEAYRATLETLRQLVPDRNEVPGLLDAISARAKIRGVYVASFVPQPVENGPPPFDTHRYRFAVIGHYDEVGEFLTDVAGLRRIFVPYDVELVAAQPAAARALGDTSRAMLEARFLVKTYVKSASAEGGSGGN
ncbi:MAG: type 4a pilus biogenesis protein PilO [Gemmatimonadales bacterium]